MKINEREVEMKEVKKFTCLDHEGNKPKGAIEGTRNQVLAWMKKTFPGIRKAADQDTFPAWQFFYKGETTTYETQNGDNLYLAEVAEDDKAPKPAKSLSVREMHRRLKKCQELSSGKYAKWMDEEVAGVVSRLIWKTAHLVPWEQAEHFVKAGHVFNWIMSTDCWFAADAANRIFHDEEELKHLLCRGLPTDKNDDADYFVQSVRHAKYIHFQTTKAFNGGFDAYIVFRIPETARAIVVRICK